ARSRAGRPARAGGTSASGPPSRPRHRRRSRRRTPSRAAPRRPRPCRRRARRRPARPPPRSPPERAPASRPAPARRAGAGRSPTRGEDRSAEGALQLLEEPLIGPVGVLVRELLELIEEAPLLLGQVARDGDVDEQALVAAATSLQDRHAAPAEDADLAGLGAGLELDLELALERRHGLLRAQGGLRDGQVDGREDVVALANEARVGANVHEHVGVARLAAEGAGVTSARQPDPLAVVDARRDLDVQLPRLEDAAAAGAVRAGALDDPARARAPRAGLSAHELAEGCAGDLLEPAGATARRADDRLRSGL